MRPETPAHLWDAREAARKAQALGNGTDQDYLDDWVKQSAAERQLEIIGEALVRVRRDDPATFRRVPDARPIVGTRNVIAHQYDVVDHVRVLALLRNDLPALIAVLDELLADATE